MPKKRKKSFRSQQWFNNPKNPDMTALYLERYLNYGLTRKELQSGNPIIGIAQSGSDLSPCNRHFMSLSKSCLLYTSPSPRDRYISRMPSSA